MADAEVEEHDLATTVAGLLASTLADEELWDLYATRADTDEWRRSMERTAVRLYRASASLFETRVAANPVDAPTPIDRALGVLFEIADYAALLSYRWPPEWPITTVPERGLIDFLVTSDELDVWSRGLGFPLALRDGSIPESGWLPEGDMRPSGDQRDLAEVVSGLLGIYETFERMFASLERTGKTVRHDFPERVAALGKIARDSLSLARGWLVWARGNLPTEIEPIAAAGVWIARGMFLALNDDKAAGARLDFPSRGFLRIAIGTDGAAWLLSEGQEVPDWLT